MYRETPQLSRHVPITSGRALLNGVRVVSGAAVHHKREQPVRMCPQLRTSCKCVPASTCQRIDQLAQTSAYPLAAQVLASLADPSGQAVAQALRAAAASLAEAGTGGMWGDVGLLPRVLAILRSLPAERSANEAVEVCAAASAVVGNLLDHNDRPQLRRQVTAAVLEDDRACRALLRWGITNPEASKQLPHGHTPHLGRCAHLLARRLV
jgi:hypothetical protein